MTAHVLGWLSLAAAAGLAWGLAIRHRELSLILFVAFSFRAVAALFHFYVAPLPDSTTDAATLERVAWAWGREGLWAALTGYDTLDSYFYSWLLSLVYSITGRSGLLAQGVSVAAGLLSVFLAWRLGAVLWGREHARKAAWVVAVFPTLVLYSALTMREAFVVVCLLAGMISLVHWARSGSVAHASKTLVGFGAATLFHGGMFLAVLGFFGLFTYRTAKVWLASLQKARIRMFATALLAAVFVAVTSYLVIGFAVPKLGGPSDMVDTQRMVDRFEYSNRGQASYPDWTVPQSGSEILWKVPIRVTYFLFAPFFWDLDKPSHLIGWFDGLLYMVVAYFLFRFRRQIWRDPGARAVLLVMLLLVAVFGLAIGNFGTSLRHRAKFVAVAVALIAPRLPNVVFRSRREAAC